MTTIITNLLTNMVVLTLQSTIPTNTAAFQSYAFNEMFSHATNMAVNWNLGLATPIKTNSVTQFQSVAYPSGIGGNIVLNDRFYFGWLYGGLPTFNDQTNSCMRAQTPDVDANDAILEQWMRATNLLTLEKAQSIAEHAMRSIGLPLETVGFVKPKVAHQFRYKWKDGKIYPLPYYEFNWETEENFCVVEVSGITATVTYFGFSGYPYLRFDKPTNYFQMLGLPTNAVFVHCRFTPPGQFPKWELEQ